MHCRCQKISGVFPMQPVVLHEVLGDDRVSTGPAVPGRARTGLWDDGQAEDTARFHGSPGSRIETVLVVDFALAGTPYQALNGGLALRIRQGRVDRRADAGPGGDGPPVGRFDRRKLASGAVRLAQGPIWPVLTECAGDAAAPPGRSGPRRRRSGPAGLVDHGQDQCRGSSSRNHRE